MPVSENERILKFSWGIEWKQWQEMSQKSSWYMTVILKTMQVQVTAIAEQ